MQILSLHRRSAELFPQASHCDEHKPTLLPHSQNACIPDQPNISNNTLLPHRHLHYSGSTRVKFITVLVQCLPLYLSWFVWNTPQDPRRHININIKHYSLSWVEDKTNATIRKSLDRKRPQHPPPYSNVFSSCRQRIHRPSIQNPTQKKGIKQVVL